ncbi:MAG: aminoacyl-tRNA deacylase [Planctomycetaceae bacterium]|nr:aminoacyl-tRNA deacylase [Planctomycetaceae bacterium]
MKTNAVRILESRGISFELREYEVDLEDLSAETVALKIQLNPEQVFKTLVVHGDRTGHFFAVVPANWQLDLKALASQSGDRKVEPVKLAVVQNLTGYIRGGVTVVGAKREFPVFVDETMELFDLVSVSGGRRGLQILLSPADFLAVTKAKVGSFIKQKT